jgi:hypothetical protein
MLSPGPWKHKGHDELLSRGSSIRWVLRLR